MRQIALWAALGLLCVAGCGGDDRSTRETKAFRQFKAKVEASCRDVATRARARGAPAQTSDIPRLAKPAFADAHHLVLTVDRIGLPAATRARVKPLRDDLHHLDDVILTDGAALQGDTSLEEGVKTAGLVVTGVGDVGSTARGLGIRCWSSGERAALATTVQAPVYLAWYRGLVGAALQALLPYKQRLGGTPAQVRKALRLKAGILGQVARKFDEADSPAYVRLEAEAFGQELNRYLDLTTTTARELRGRRFISDAFAARYNRRSKRVEDRLNAATRALVGVLERGIPAPAGPDLDGIVPS